MLKKLLAVYSCVVLPFVALGMLQFTCSIWLVSPCMEIVLQRNKITVQVSVGQQNARPCHLLPLSRRITIQPAGLIYTLSLFNPSAHTLPVHSHLQLLSVSRAALICCVELWSQLLLDLLAHDQTAVYF